MQEGPKTNDIMSQLLANAARVKYGEAMVTLKIHEGKIVHVTHSITETSTGPGLPIAGETIEGTADDTGCSICF